MSALLERPSPAARIRRDPVGASRHMLGVDPWSLQQQIIRSVWEHPRTAVRTGNGLGKTKVAFGIVGPLFLLAHPDSVVVTTAPTWRQVKELGWREWRASWGVMRQRMAAQPQLREVPIPACLTTSVDLGEQWHAYGVSTREPEAFAGVHSRRVLLIVDEASGVDERIYEAGEGFLTGGHARVLLIGNPTKPSGQFHAAFHSQKAAWNTLHMGAHQSPNFTDEGRRLSQAARDALVDPAWVEDKARRWGVESPLYQVRVLGNFADQSDDTIISLVSVENAQQRDCEQEGAVLTEHPRVDISCDVARFGNDKTVIMRKRGPLVELVRVYHGRDTMTTAGYCLDAVRSALRAPQVHRVRLIVDDDGVGGGVTDRLRETMSAELQTDRVGLVAYHGGAAAIRPDRFVNKRTESWFRAKWQMPTLDIPADDELSADLVSLQYKMTSAGQLAAEKKDDLKKRLSRSPDHGDALVMLLEPEAPGKLANPTEDWHPDVPDGDNAYDLDF